MASTACPIRALIPAVAPHAFFQRPPGPFPGASYQRSCFQQERHLRPGDSSILKHSDLPRPDSPGEGPLPWPARKAWPALGPTLWCAGSPFFLSSPSFPVCGGCSRCGRPLWLEAAPRCKPVRVARRPATHVYTAARAGPQRDADFIKLVNWYYSAMRREAEEAVYNLSAYARDGGLPPTETTWQTPFVVPPLMSIAFCAARSRAISQWGFRPNSRWS